MTFFAVRHQKSLSLPLPVSVSHLPLSSTARISHLETISMFTLDSNHLEELNMLTIEIHFIIYDFVTIRSLNT